ncbi:questin oxidase family protein [Actinocatenispora sera]|uniref:DUF4243 domain-containing protein n=1 Tax=Actinocatenispora sera TaxID=390989 RepID=A0A810L1X3_9ACTN|nr:questin oxidase family protein [Actinocatenispora sera]BCJ28456.1 hypothetical protein Asera_25640 [Actinocatenispora sera]
MNSGALDDAYERLHRMGPEYEGDRDHNNGLTNHGPMAAEVLARRGYGDRIGRWVDGYLPRLVELPDTRQPIAEANWTAALGDGSRVADWVDHFRRELADRPWREVLVEWWPRLLPGIVAGSTHGLIRVGHAVRALQDGATGPAGLDEFGHGLAFWAARSRPVPAAHRPAGHLEPDQALAGIPHLADQSGLIVQRLGRLAELPGWPAAQAALRAPAAPAEVPELLERLVDAAVLRYLERGHGSPVLLVHTATAPNAVLHTLPLLPDELWAPSLAAVWSASAAIVSAYEPAQPLARAELPAAPRGDDPATAIVERATDHGDEHVMKFTDTAVEAYERTGDPDTLAAARHIVELTCR